MSAGHLTCIVIVVAVLALILWCAVGLSSDISRWEEDYLMNEEAEGDNQ